MARAYFAALSDHDIDAALALWRADATAPAAEQADTAELTAIFEELFGAFPDWRFEIIETTTHRERCAVRWRASGTFAGPRRLAGYVANGSRVDIEGCDVLTVRNGQIVDTHLYMDRAELLAQLGLLAREGSARARGRSMIANLGGALRRGFSHDAQVIAPGVWLLRGGVPPTMNVYLLREPDGGVTVFDAGVAAMAPAIATAAARLGGLSRFVLGHADCDHRGGAAGLGAPVYTHALEVAAAESPARQRPYWDLHRLTPYARPIYPLLFRGWDGGALTVAGTVAEGDMVADFRVVELPGHAPGLIGLFREEDGLALCSDALYTLNVETGAAAPPRVPHAAFNADTEQARASLMKLAGLGPRVVWAGHARPVAGADVVEQLIRAAQA